MEERRTKIDAAMDALIVLALIASMLEDAADATAASLKMREALGFASFVFDALFVLEFASRFAKAAMDGRRGAYGGRGLGWLDFLTSIPLLAFVSGPFAIGSIVGGTAAHGALAVARASGPLRALRALRLLRAIRILSSVKGRESVATRRHVVRAASLCMLAVVAAFALVEVASMTMGAFASMDQLRAQGLVSLGAAFAALAAAAALVFLYGPFFAAGVSAPLLASIRWARGEDSRVRALAPADREDEEPFVLAALLDNRALLEAGIDPEAEPEPFPERDPPWPEPTGRAEMEGLLARAQAYGPRAEDGDDAERPTRG